MAAKRIGLNIHDVLPVTQEHLLRLRHFQMNASQLYWSIALRGLILVLEGACTALVLLLIL